MKNVINIKRIATYTVIILLVPFVLTLLNSQSHLRGGNGGGWDWGVGDFFVMGALIFTTGCALDLARRKIINPVRKIIACIAIVLTLLLIWVELAVDGVSQLLSYLF